MTDWSVIVNAGRPHRLSHRRYRSCPIRHCEKPTGRNEPKHMFASSRREAPEPLMNLPPKEGVGNAGCPLHPRPRVHLVLVERTRVTTSTPESPGIPARNGFNGLCRALPGDRALLPPSPTDMFLSKPGRADLNSASLTPASGRQDHTILPYAATSLVRSLLIAHKSFNSPCNPFARKTLPRPPHSTPRP